MLPAATRMSIEALFEGVSRSEVTRAARSLSETYRGGEAPSEEALTTRDAALAYLAVRLPATFESAAEVMRRTTAALPDWSPTTMLDLGAGPGTTSLAAAAIWPTISSYSLVERSAVMSGHGRQILAESGNAALVAAEWRHDELGAIDRFESHDLVAAAYVLSELTMAEGSNLVEKAWRACDGALVIVEPGSKRGFETIRRVRRMLIDLGAYLAAPCPHTGDCPISGDDWCHFSVRIQRSRLHREVKGATTSYEDEPFSYVVASRHPPVVGGDRVLSRPRVTKGFVELKLCSGDGQIDHRVVRRPDHEQFRAARDASWGSSIP